MTILILFLFKGHKALLDIGTEWCCAWSSPLEPKLWLGVQTHLGMSEELMGQGTRSLFTGVNEELPETEHVLRKRVKHTELEPERKTKS